MAINHKLNTFFYSSIWMFFKYVSGWNIQYLTLTVFSIKNFGNRSILTLIVRSPLALFLMALTVAEAFKKLFLMAQMALFDFSLWPLTYRTINQKVSFQRTVTFPYGTVTFPYDLSNSLQQKVNFWISRSNSVFNKGFQYKEICSIS